jgi:hypothetical protein
LAGLLDGTEYEKDLLLLIIKLAYCSLDYVHFYLTCPSVSYVVLNENDKEPAESFPNFACTRVKNK